MRALWHRQLAVPLAGGEEALAAYEAWEAATGKVRVERCMFSVKFVTALGALVCLWGESLAEARRRWEPPGSSTAY